jgi:type II secretory pathway component GspD/PulD (secretin)
MREASGISRLTVRKVIRRLLSGLVMVTVSGCVHEPPPSVPATAAGSVNPPVVISSRSESDAAAFSQASEQLTQADWEELEKLGPRPIWERIESLYPHRRSLKHVAPSPTTRPILTVSTIDESQLPVQVIDLPDNKVRLIWTLQNYGGPAVKAGRDQATNFRTVQLALPDLTPLVAVLTQAINGTGGTVCPLPEDNAMIVTCTKPMKPMVLTLLNDLDRPPRQVEITAKIFEVSHDFDFQQGTELVLNRLASSGSQTLISTFSAKRFLEALNGTAPTPVQGSVLHLMQAFQSAGISLDVSFQLLEEAGLIQVVSEPRMTVAVGQTGYLQAGQEIPIQSTNIANNAVVTLATTYKPIGVQLYITPETASAQRVKLHTISVVSAIDGFTDLPLMVGGNNPVQNPIINSREAETAVTVDEGSTLVISGLRMIRTTTREDKIPGLGDVPVLGWLFKNHRSQQKQTDLYFFITPTLL